MTSSLFLSKKTPYKRLDIFPLLIFLTYSLLLVPDTYAQLKCPAFMKAQALDYIRAEESGGRNHGECGLQYQMFDENKCHSWTAALWDPMVYEAKQCAKKFDEVVCVHNITVILPGGHNYIGVTVSKDGFRSTGLTVDGWRCERSDQSIPFIEYHTGWYEMPPLYDSGDNSKRFTFNINQSRSPRGRQVGKMISLGKPPLWTPAWIEPDGLEIGAAVECFGGTPTPTPTPRKTPTRTPTTAATKTPVRTPTPRPTRTPGGQECGEGIGSCIEPACCSSAGICGTDPESCGEGCNPLFGSCLPTPTPTPAGTPTIGATPTATPGPSRTPTPQVSGTPTRVGVLTAVPCKTVSIEGGFQRTRPCVAEVTAVEAR